LVTDFSILEVDSISLQRAKELPPLQHRSSHSFPSFFLGEVVLQTRGEFASAFHLLPFPSALRLLPNAVFCGSLRGSAFLPLQTFRWPLPFMSVETVSKIFSLSPTPPFYLASLSHLA